MLDRTVYWMEKFRVESTGRSQAGRWGGRAPDTLSWGQISVFHFLISESPTAVLLSLSWALPQHSASSILDFKFSSLVQNVEFGRTPFPLLWLPIHELGVCIVFKRGCLASWSGKFFCLWRTFFSSSRKFWNREWSLKFFNLELFCVLELLAENFARTHNSY